MQNFANGVEFPLPVCAKFSWLSSFKKLDQFLTRRAVAPSQQVRSVILPAKFQQGPAWQQVSQGHNWQLL